MAKRDFTLSDPRWNHHQGEPAIPAGPSTTTEAFEQELAAVDFSSVTRESTRGPIAAAPEEAGALRLAAAQQEEAGKQRGAQVRDMLAPTYAVIEEQRRTLDRLEADLRAHESKVLGAIEDLAVHAVSVCDQSVLMNGAVDTLRATIPALPDMARAA